MIPVYINVFNRLETTRNLVNQVNALEHAVPVIIDNDSTYEPLLEWYATGPCDIVRLRENLGHHAPWKSGVISSDGAWGYVVTDCDLDISGVPLDVLSVLMKPFSWHSRSPVKSGLALRIDDLPPWQSEVVAWESRWWKHVVSQEYPFYMAPIDTTFAMYQGSTPHRSCMRVSGVYSLRLAGSYQARHMPWYLDCENLDAENAQYFETANESNSWRPSGKSLTAEYSMRNRRTFRRA